MVCSRHDGVGRLLSSVLSDEVKAGFAATQHSRSVTPGPYLGFVCVLEAGSWCGTLADLQPEAINLPASASGTVKLQACIIMPSSGGWFCPTGKNKNLKPACLEIQTWLLISERGYFVANEFLPAGLLEEERQKLATAFSLSSEVGLTLHS